MPSFSSSSMIQLSSSEELEAGGGREGSLSTSGQRRWRRGSLTVPSSQELQVLPKAHPPWSLSGFPWLPWPGLTEVPKLGVELVSQRPKDQP